ncbi:MAG TPA: hypothetical protein VN688_00755 [Gemmataceae bacterium]|nr:hypothetical protein [Gemmataceae bacterium]
MVSLDPQHLPKCPINPERYDRLYAFNQGLDDQMPDAAEWREIRIKTGQPEEEVYRLLPSAADFECSGYLTKSLVRYIQAASSSAGMMMAKPCTFHSHPTRNPYLADVPSLQDIHSFLFYRHLRSVTVGATKIWVWDKTRATLGTVRKLAEWMNANHFRVVNHWMRKDFANWQTMYVQTVMKHLGWVWPDTIEEMDAQWPRMLRKVFKIKVRIFSRDPGVTAR